MVNKSKCISCANHSSTAKKRTRSDIPWDVKVRHHAYLIPLIVGVVLVVVAYKQSNK